MREYGILCRLQLTSLFGINKLRFGRDAEEKKKRRKEIALLLIVVVVFANMSVTYSIGLASALQAMDAMPALLTVMLAASSCFMLLTSVFQAKSVLVTFGDYDTVNAWPVPAWAVAASRITTLYLYNLAFMLLLLGPAGIVYAAFTRPELWYYPVFLLMTLLSPAVPTFLGGVIGIGIAELTAGRKGKSLLSTVFQMAFVVAIVVGSMRLNTLMENIGSIASSISGRFEAMYPPSAWFSSGCAQGNPLSILLFGGVSAVLMGLQTLWLSRRSPKLYARITAQYQDRSFRLRRQERTGVVRALFGNELKRYFSSSIYVTNTAVGAVLLLVACVILLIKKDTVTAFMEQMNLPQLYSLVPFAMGWIVVMSGTTSSSVSMEGKRLWIIKSLPVRARDWYLGKMLVSLLMILPASILSAAMVCYALPLSAADRIWIFVVPTAYALFTAVFGLMLNLRLNKFDWKSEAEVVKQSTSAMVGVFGSMILAAIPIALTMTVGGNWIAPAMAGALLISSWIIWKSICCGGEQKMLRLNELGSN